MNPIIISTRIEQKNEGERLVVQPLVIRTSLQFNQFLATTESTVPGFIEPPSVIPSAAPGPSVGQMLLAKDGWLKKHQDEDSSVPLPGTVGHRRGGLGFDSRETQRSEIMKKTLDRLNKL